LPECGGKPEESQTTKKRLRREKRFSREQGLAELQEWMQGRGDQVK
jgi:hypothetical protein